MSNAEIKLHSNQVFIDHDSILKWVNEYIGHNFEKPLEIHGGSSSIGNREFFLRIPEDYDLDKKELINSVEFKYGNPWIDAKSAVYAAMTAEAIPRRNYMYLNDDLGTFD